MFDLTGKVSANPHVDLRWSYNMPDLPTIGALASVRWTDLNMLNLGQNRLSLNMFKAKQEFFLSSMNWNRQSLKGGLRNEIITLKNIKSSQILGDYNFTQTRNDYVSAFLETETYTFDDGYFPTRGVDARVSYSWVFAGMPHRIHNFHILQADAKFVIPAGERFAFIPSLNFRFLLGEDIPVAYFNAVGGSMAGRYVDQQIPFVGINNLSAMKNILTQGRLDFRYTLAKNHYLTGIFNYARDCDRFSEYLKGIGYYGAGLEYSFDTIFGPLSANVHWSNMTNTVGFYLSAGYNF